MPVQPVTTPIAQLMAPTTVAAPQRSTSVDRDTFMKLLVAQLKNQDPTNPVEGAEFLAQTAQFTMVEKLEEVAKQNIELLAATRMSSASALVGRQVSYSGADGAETAGIVTAVRITADGPVLKVGATDVAMSDVLGVSAPPPPTPTPTPAPTPAPAVAPGD